MRQNVENKVKRPSIKCKKKKRERESCSHCGVTRKYQLNKMQQKKLFENKVRHSLLWKPGCVFRYVIIGSWFGLI